MARAVIATGSRPASPPRRHPRELDGRLLSYADLRATPAAALGPRAVDRRLDLTVTMADGGRRWLINDREYADRQPLQLAQGERVRLRLRNDSAMFHPMHLHGHTFAIASPDGRGVRKDTVNVLPGRCVTVDLDADNPGQWLAHCHNAYHGELGMMTVLSYVSEPTAEASSTLLGTCIDPVSVVSTV